MDVLTYVTQELPDKRSGHIIKQLDYLGLTPGKTVKDSKIKILQYYLDNHLDSLLLYYQMGVKVGSNPENTEGLTTMVNKLFGIWSLKDKEGNPVPATTTRPYRELYNLYSEVKA